MVDSTGHPILLTREAIKQCHKFWTSRVVMVVIVGIAITNVILKYAELSNFWSMNITGMGFNYQTMVVLTPYVFSFLSGIILAWSVFLTYDLRRATNLLHTYNRLASFSTICIHGILISSILIAGFGAAYIAFNPALNYISLGAILMLWMCVPLFHMSEVIYKTILLASDDPEEIIENHSII